VTVCHRSRRFLYYSQQIVLVLTFRYRTEVIKFLRLKSQAKQPIITAPIEEIEMQPKANVNQTFDNQGRPMYPIMTG